MARNTKYMSIHPATLPDAFKRCMADRPKNREHQTTAEAEVKFEKRRERELHKMFLSWLHLNSLAYVHSRMDRPTTANLGVPDFIVCCNGKAACVEFKAGGRKSMDPPCAGLSDEQKIWRAKQGGDGYLVTNSVSDAIYFTQRWLGIIGPRLLT